MHKKCSFRFINLKVFFEKCFFDKYLENFIKKSWSFSSGFPIVNRKKILPKIKIFSGMFLK